MTSLLFHLTDTVRVALLFTLLFILCGIEMVIPLIKSKRGSLLKTLPNLVLTAMLIFVNFLLSIFLTLAGLAVERHDVGLFQWLGGAPLPVLCIAGLVALDFWAAWLPHFLMHKLPFWWRFHAVHHSDVMVDVTTAFRQHPFETVWRFSFYVSGMLLFGLPLPVLVLYLACSATNAQLEHSNIRLPQRLDKFLQFFIVTPNMHKLHHSKYQAETDSNYGNIFSFWDRLFKTYRRRNDYANVEYGLDYLDAADFSLKEMLIDIPKKS